MMTYVSNRVPELSKKKSAVESFMTDADGLVVKWQQFVVDTNLPASQQNSVNTQFERNLKSS